MPAPIPSLRRRSATWPAWLAAGALLAGNAAQGQLPSTACSPTPAADTVARTTLYLNLRPQSMGPYEWLKPDDLRRLTLMLQYVQQKFAPPASIDAPRRLPNAFPPIADHDLERIYGTPSVFAKIEFRAHADGRLSIVRVTDASNAPALDSALVRALTDAGEQELIGSFAFAPDDADERVPDRLDLVMRMSTSADTSGASHPLAIIHLGIYPIARTSPSRANGEPPYPPEVRNIGLRGEVVLQIFVTADGRAEADSVRVQRSTHPAFTRAALQHVPALRYTPASLGGCPVPMWIHQLFSFRPES